MIGNRWVLYFFRLVIGGVFIWAGALKAADPLDFAQTIKNYQVFPHALIFVIAVILPWVEMLSGAGLIVGILKRSSALIAAVLLAGFMVLVGSVVLRGIDTACGCFGSFSHKANLVLILMDAVLFFMALNVFLASGPKKAAPTSLSSPL